MGEQTTISRRKMLGMAGLTLGSVAGTALLSACGTNVAASGAGHTLYLSIITGRMFSHKGFPAYVPTDITVPANTAVTVRVANFDDGTAPLPDGSPYLSVTGVVGGQATAQAISMDTPNVPGPGKAYQTLAGKDLAHTFTVAGLKLNVPMPVSSVVTFTFNSGKPGTYPWQCNAPCGTGPGGVAGPMVMPGYMVGTLRVV